MLISRKAIEDALGESDAHLGRSAGVHSYSDTSPYSLDLRSWKARRTSESVDPKCLESDWTFH